MASSAFDFLITGKDQSGAAFDSLKRNARDAEGALEKMGNPLEELQRGAEKLDIIFKAFLGFEIVSRLGEFHNSVKETAAALKTQADAVGLSTDHLQAYQAAARTAGVGVDAMQTALGNFNVALGRASQGDKETAEAFQRLGVRILDVNGKVRENAVLFGETSRALLTLEDTANRAADAKKLLGKAGQQLTPILREAAKGVDELDAESQRLSLTMNRETIETFKRLSVQSDEAGIKIKNLYGAFAAPIEAGAKSWLARQMEEIANSVALIGAHRGVLDQIMEVVHVLSGGLGAGGTDLGTAAADRATRAIDQARAKAVEEQVELQRLEGLRKRVGGIWGFTTDGALDSQRKRAEDAQAQVKAAEDVLRRFENRGERVQGGLSDNAPDLGLGANRFAQAKPSGGADRDRIGEEMQQLTGNVDAARLAYEQLRAAAATAVSTEDLQRQVELQKKISSELARIGKYAKDDPRVPQIKALVTEHERYEFAIKSLENAIKVADSTEKAYGDGKAALAKTQYELNQALATGRLGQDAYTAANREAILVQQEQAAKAYQYKEGLDAVAAGMEYARIQSQRQNSAFNQGVALYNEGKQAFSSFTKEVSDGLMKGASVWDTFANAGVNALNRISDKLLQMAADQLFNAAFGGSGGGGAGGLGGLFGAGGGISNLLGGGSWGSAASGVGSTVPDFIAAGGFAFAGGGDYDAGVPRLVGEHGPELDVPRRAGTIFNRDQIAGMGGGAAPIHILLSLDNEMLDARVDTRVGAASPRIISVAVNKARDQVVPTMNSYKAERGGDYRG